MAGKWVGIGHIDDPEGGFKAWASNDEFSSRVEIERAYRYFNAEYWFFYTPSKRVAVVTGSHEWRYYPDLDTAIASVMLRMSRQDGQQEMQTNQVFWCR